MHRRARPHFPRQRVPLHACAQYIHHGLKGLAIIHSASSSLGMRRRWWDQRTDSLPHFITHFPRFGSCHWFLFYFFPSILPRFYRFSDKLLILPLGLRPLAGDFLLR